MRATIDVSKLTPVTDPDLLKQLQGSNNKLGRMPEPGYLETLAPNILSGLAEMGHSVLNAPSNVANYLSEKNIISPESAKMVPRQPDFNYAESLMIPKSTSNDITRSVVKNLPSMLIPELKLGSQIPSALKYIPEALSRIGGQAAWGGLTNENVGEGAKEFGGMQALMEGIGAPFRLTKGLAELINPLQETQRYANKIQKGYEGAVQSQREAYDPVTKKYGEEFVLNSPILDLFKSSLKPEEIKKVSPYFDKFTKNYLGFTKKEMKYFTPEVKKSYQEFIDYPSFQNLHDLQSQMGKDARSLAGNTNKINTYQTLINSRESLKDKIKEFLSRDQDALSNYMRGAQITKNKVEPYKINDVLEKIAKGKIKDLKPNELINAIKKGTEELHYPIPENHSLIPTMKSLESKVNKGQAIRELLPFGTATAGALGLGGLTDPLVGSLSGAGLGAILGKYAFPSALNVAQNPYVNNLLGKQINPLATALGRQYTGYNLYNK